MRYLYIYINVHILYNFFLYKIHSLHRLNNLIIVNNININIFYKKKESDHRYNDNRKHNQYN